MSFKEAKLSIEYKLTQTKTPTPNDFYAQEANGYHKYVFGEIIHIWVNPKMQGFFLVFPAFQTLHIASE